MDDTLANTDQFGESVVSPGDLDGDGVADLVVGAHRDEDSGCSDDDCGAVWVFLLQGQPSPGTVKDTYHAGDALSAYAAGVQWSALFLASLRVLIQGLRFALFSA